MKKKNSRKNQKNGLDFPPLLQPSSPGDGAGLIPGYCCNGASPTLINTTYNDNWPWNG